MLASIIVWTFTTTAHADPCKKLGVGKDPGSSIAVTTMVRHLAGFSATKVTLELRGDGTRLVVVGPPGAEVPVSEPGVFAFEGGTRASWAQDERSKEAGLGRYVFRLDGEQLALLEGDALTYVALPLKGGEIFELNTDKDNQKTVQAGARCILSRTAP